MPHVSLPAVPLPVRKPRPTPAEEAPPPAHLPEILERLAAEYLPTSPAPRVSAEPLDDLIRIILAQQNTGEAVRRQFGALRSAYPVWEAALADGPDGIEAVLRGAGGGLARIKAAYIWGVLNGLEEALPSPDAGLSLHHLRSLNDAEVRALLESLPGVGMKTASLLLLFDLARPAIPIDTHIHRVARRLELFPERWNVLKAERWFDEVLPREWGVRSTFHVSAIRHGRQTCRTGRPRCERCVLQDLCPSAGVFLHGAEQGLGKR
ncbi:endonuclease III domain-containing protein [Deinococcus hopiensis]|uniref:Endonuclease-3 n=1 Tax=Deinococcus hopiensis KR-140 TaxID=695939 RepID=A0A1W1VI67_9DEIO|nr:endonuclease III [Deinococcus hopiensis]SMB92644.1 endonuclease-3 [Deinococcus hopiensis KR-140]